MKFLIIIFCFQFLSYIRVLISFTLKRELFSAFQLYFELICRDINCRTVGTSYWLDWYFLIHYFKFIKLELDYFWCILWYLILLLKIFVLLSLVFLFIVLTQSYLRKNTIPQNKLIISPYFCYFWIILKLIEYDY
mgnify:CR=1 FL=1